MDMTWGGNSKLPNRFVVKVISVVTGSPCFVRMRTPAPTILKPMNMPIPSATNAIAPITFMLSMIPEAKMPIAK